MSKKIFLLFLILVFIYPVSSAQYNVTIYRDEYWVPHVYSDSLEGLFFGYGYAQAQDQILQIDEMVRIAKGTTAEVYGQQKYEFPDKTSRLYQIYKKVEENYDTLDLESKIIVESFAAGINKYVEDHRSEMPSRIQTYTGIDILAAGYSLYYYDTQTQIKDAIASHLGTQSGLNLGEFSNTWAIASSKTSSGKAILYGEPHVQIAPDETGWWNKRWYEAHLNGPGLNTMGVSLIASPLIAIGFNENIAWSQTNNEADNADVYLEKINPNNPLQYEYDGQWRDMEQKTETIYVLNEITNELEPRQETFYYTIHGPVLPNLEDDEGHKFSVKFTFSEQVDLVTQLYEINKATNLNDFKNTMSRVQIPKYNFMYADKDGHIYYLFNGRFPKINSLPNWQNYDWGLPVPGWTSETNWQSIHSLGELPQLTDPSNGFMQNTNNHPKYSTPDALINPNNYPSYMLEGGFGRRASRTLDLLNNNGNSISFEKAKQIALDDLSLKSSSLLGFQNQEDYNGYKEILLYAYDNYNTYNDPLFDEAISMIRTWNNKTNKESEAAALFNTFYINLEKTCNSHPTQCPSNLDKPQNPENLPQSQLTGILDVFYDNVYEFKNLYGSIHVPWGDIHVYKRGSRLFNVGGYQNLHSMNAKLGSDDLYYVDAGPSYTFLVEFRTPKTYAISMKPYGNTEKQESVHYDDTTELFANNQFKDAMLYLEDIENNLDSNEPVKKLSYIIGEENQTQCGNGILEDGEECDGNDFNGLECIDFGYTQGNLICTSNCDIDISNCTLEQEPPPEPPNGNETQPPPEELPKEGLGSKIKNFLTSSKTLVYIIILVGGIFIALAYWLTRKKESKRNV